MLDRELQWEAAQGPSRGASSFLKREIMLLLLAAWIPAVTSYPGDAYLRIRAGGRNGLIKPENHLSQSWYRAGSTS